MTIPPDRQAGLNVLGDSIALAQASDPFALVTVVVPSPFARVQLRRAVGGAKGLCNVTFRTWREVTSDLARLAADRPLRIPSSRAIDEALRQSLLTTSSAFESFAHAPTARAELVRLLYDLWGTGDALLSQLAEAGNRAAALGATLAEVEAYLAARGFTNPGEVLDLAAVSSVGDSLGSVVRWYPSRLRRRDRAILDSLARQGVPVSTIDTDPDRPGSIEREIAARDPDEEVRVVLRHLLSATEAGTPLWRQAIIVPETERYRRVVHQQLRAAGVPTCGPSPMTLAQSVAGRALLGLLTLAAGEWRRADVIRWLSTAPIVGGAHAPRAPVGRWDGISARAGVVEGLAQWRTRLARFAHDISSTNPHAARNEGEAHAALALAEFVEAVAVDVAHPHGGWSDWATWATGLLERYLDASDDTVRWPPHERAAAEGVREALSALAELDQVSTATHLIAFRQAIEAELSTTPVRDDGELARPASEGESDPAPRDRSGVPGPFGTGVFVGTPAEARGLAFERVIVVGMADQYLPGPALGTSLLPGIDIDDPDWPTRERRAEELLDDVRAVLALAEQPVTVSRPLVDPRTGREHDRSRWIGLNGPLSGGWTEETVASFWADVAGDAAAALPVSAADRLLGSLARTRSEGRTIDRHPAVIGDAAFDPRRPRPPLAASLESARATQLAAFGRFEGNVGPELPHGVSGEVSPTRLEQYAGCPRRYLFDRELRVRPPIRPEANEQMEPRDRGTLIHEILAIYVGERIDDGTGPSLARLLAIGEERFSIAEEEGRCGPALVATVERATLMRELRRLFEEDTLAPEDVELQFGGMGAMDDLADDRSEATAQPEVRRPRARAVEVSLEGGRTLRFTGSIDRVDRAPDGSLVISDYKTGRQGDLGKLTRDPVVAGTRLQLPIYGLAAKAHYGWEGPVRARYWLTSWEREQPSLICEIDDRVLERFKEVVTTISEGIEAGVFPGNPGDETYRNGRPGFENCWHCDYHSVCPTDRDRRWAALGTAPELAPVLRLGEDPDPGLGGLVTRAPLDLGAGDPP